MIFNEEEKDLYCCGNCIHSGYHQAVESEEMLLKCSEEVLVKPNAWDVCEYWSYNCMSHKERLK